MEVVEDFVELEELFQRATMQFVIMVGRWELLSYLLYFLLLVDRAHRLSTMFNQFSYDNIWNSIFEMWGVAMGR